VYITYVIMIKCNEKNTVSSSLYYEESVVSERCNTVRVLSEIIRLSLSRVTGDAASH